MTDFGTLQITTDLNFVAFRLHLQKIHEKVKVSDFDYN